MTLILRDMKVRKKPKLQRIGDIVTPVSDSETLFIGIDPDRIKSGVAIWNTQTQCYELLDCIEFFDLTELIENLHKERSEEVTVVIENGKGNKKIFVPKIHIARCVGWNEETGSKIAEWCKRIGVKVILATPNKNRYAKFGLSSQKVSAAKFNALTKNKYPYKVNPYKAQRKSKLNEEIRDAAMLVLNLF